MNIFIYSDESGVLDKKHNDFFVFAGLVFLSKEERDDCSRKYISAEKIIRNKEGIPQEVEIKATTICNQSKGKLFRSLNQTEKFGIVIQQRKLFDNMFQSKKTKQRYLDWAYKMAVKSKLELLISEKLIVPDEVQHLYFFVDEHTTATDGFYELKESLEQEFRYGIYNYEYMTYHPALFPNLRDVQLKHCDSRTNTLIRSADIVANKLFYMAIKNDYSGLTERRFSVKFHP